MLDIKALYLNARDDYNHDNVQNYHNAIVELSHNDPYGFITQLEYIITSDKGLHEFESFIEHNNISVGSYNDIRYVFDKVIDKYESKSISPTIYENSIKLLDNYYIANNFAISMYENYGILNDAYFVEYYTKGVANKQFDRIINKHGLSALPDMIKDSSNKDYIVSCFINNKIFNTPTHFEWVNNVISQYDVSDNLIEYVNKRTCSYKYEMMKSKQKNDELRCKLLMENYYDTYLESDIDNILDLIYVYESQLLTDCNNKQELMSNIYELYSEISFIDDMYLSENLSHKNTLNKKTGMIPDYIQVNHDMGEEGDSANNRAEPTLDDYARSSTSNDDSPIVDDDDDIIDDDIQLPVDNPSTPSGNTNYYYYTYTNSNNTNTNSHNSEDDHSVNHTRNIDDHSVSKQNSNQTSSLVSSEILSDSEDLEKTINKNEKSWDLSHVGRLQSNYLIEDKNHISEIDDVDTSDPTEKFKFKHKMVTAGDKIETGVDKLEKNLDDSEKSITRPTMKVKGFLDRYISRIKDHSENKAKEEMADPHARSKLMKAIRTAVIAGSLAKAGVLFNFAFIGVYAFHKVCKTKRDFRLRNEMIGELKTERRILKDKIRVAGYDNPEYKHRMMRLDNELKKKLVRVGGSKNMRKKL